MGLCHVPLAFCSKSLWCCVTSSAGTYSALTRVQARSSWASFVHFGVGGGECFPQKEHPKMLFIRYRSSYHLPILVAKWKIQTCIGCDIHSTWFLLLLLPLSKFPYQTDNLYTAFSTSCTFKDTQVKTWITCIPTPWFLELCVWTIGISVLVSGSEYLSLCKMIPQPHKLFAADTKIYLNKTSYCYMQPLVSGWSRMW